MVIGILYMCDWVVEESGRRRVIVQVIDFL